MASHQKNRISRPQSSADKHHISDNEGFEYQMVSSAFSQRPTKTPDNAALL
jgi:hypothetical protein